MAFILSGMFAGLAGGLLAFRATNVVSNDFNFANALLWVLMVVVGGLGNRTGVVIGSAFFALFPFLIELIGPLDRFVSGTLNRNPAEFTPVIGAALAILTIIRFPGGIAEQLSPITRWLGGKRFSMHPDGGHGEAHSPKKTVLSKLGLHKDEAETATDAPAEEIRNDEEPNLADQPEEPAGVSGREDS
jgi:branched-chain amino acid transport system permease protein